MILLTDGEENVATAQTPEEIAPVHAAQLCKELGVRVYAIAVGSSDRGAPDGRLSVDTSQIRKMAETLRRRVLRGARRRRALARLRPIDRLEKAVIEEPRFRIEERFLPFLGVALALLLGSRLVRTALGVLAP